VLAFEDVRVTSDRRPCAERSTAQRTDVACAFTRARAATRDHQAEKRCAEVLRFVWEGLLFEYLRCVGAPLRTQERDPRNCVVAHWRRSVTDPRGGGAASFVPYYL
jgi:hypothetical protein